MRCAAVPPPRGPPPARKPPSPSWGNILSEGYTALRQAPHVVIVAGIPLVLATLGFTFLGEGLRDVLDPRGAGRRPG